MNAQLRRQERLCCLTPPCGTSPACGAGATPWAPRGAEHLTTPQQIIAAEDQGDELIN